MIKADLSSCFGIRAREHIAIVGAGGKTSLLLALAEELRSKGGKAITTTTTKVRISEARKAPDMLLISATTALDERIKDGIEKSGHLFLGESLLLSHKVKGIDPSLADAIFKKELSDYLIVEADGAAGMSLKAHATHEPVIPSSATMVVALMGLEVFGKAFTHDLVFRAEIFRELTGISQGEPISAEILSRLFKSDQGPFKGSPEAARRIVFLNKLDLSVNEEEAERLAHEILKGSSKWIDRVVMGSIKEGFYRSKGHE
jgi:probable selenium-dependent hydroxylase accessory protein YqeC